MIFFPLQILSIALTAWLYLGLVEFSLWTPMVFALGFCHYVVAMIYSARPLHRLSTQSYSYLPLLLLLGAGWWLYEIDFPLAIFFAVHHLFNEAYLKAKIFPEIERAAGSPPAAFLLSLLHGSAYFLLVFSQAMSPWLAIALVVVLLWSLAAYLVRVRPLLQARQPLKALNLVGFECLSVALVPVSFFYQFDFKLIVFYHFVIWGLLPLQHQLATGRIRQALSYVAISVAVFVPFYLVSPLGPPAYQVMYMHYAEQFFFWSYFHITISFALSRAHPGWINHWFAPRSGRQAPA